jgi:hypothetical protein
LASDSIQFIVDLEKGKDRATVVKPLKQHIRFKIPDGIILKNF